MKRAFGWVLSNPLVRGSLTIGGGIVLGNVIGFVRVALTAYLLGTRAHADALAIAISPVDSLNSILMNTMLFAFVPMLMLRQGPERLALFRRANQVFTWIFSSLALAIALCAPLLIHILGPGLEPGQVPVAINILRIASLSTLASGAAAVQSALLYTERRFGPTAFYQATINVFTIAAALICWPFAGIYGFALGYLLGAAVQFGLVYFSARRYTRQGEALPRIATPWRELLSKPGAFLLYAGIIALNVIVTRAHATHAGAGMAAAFDYCIRCVNVVIAYLVAPVSNSLLPEIARLHARRRERDAWRLIDRTTALIAGAALASCVLGVLLRKPVIAILFQRGNFTAESTILVSGVFLGFAPSLIGWTLLELTSRSLFALDRRWLPLSAAAIPVVVNLVFSAFLRSRGLTGAAYIGLGASLGLLLAFAVLFTVAHIHRRGGPEKPDPTPEPALQSVA